MRPGGDYVELAVACFAELGSLQVFRDNSGRIFRRGAILENWRDTKLTGEEWEHWEEAQIQEIS